MTPSGHDSDSRAAVRDRLRSERFAAWRQGVWARPANLPWVMPDEISPTAELVVGRPRSDPVVLAHALFDVGRWATTALALSELISADTGLGTRTAVAATMVRHLVADPLLPRELLPIDWPGDDLRARYAEFSDQLRARLLKR